MSEEKKETGTETGAVLGVDEETGGLNEAEIKSIRKRGWGKLVLCAVAIAALILLMMTLIKFLGESIGEGLRELGGGTTVVVPVIERIDASGCQPGQYTLEGNTLKFKDCAKPVFAKPALNHSLRSGSGPAAK